MEFKIIRDTGLHNDVQTTGFFEVLDDNQVLYECYTLELPWRDNQKNISCIPIGTYMVKRRWSWRHKNHIEILDVPNRSYILIHPGNYYTDIRGCILPGDSFQYINNDAYVDIANSRNTMNDILSYLQWGVEYVLEIA